MLGFRNCGTADRLKAENVSGFFDGIFLRCSSGSRYSTLADASFAVGFHALLDLPSLSLIQPELQGVGSERGMFDPMVGKAVLTFHPESRWNDENAKEFAPRQTDVSW